MSSTRCISASGQLFREVATRWPDAIAIASLAGDLSYGDLLRDAHHRAAGSSEASDDWWTLDQAEPMDLAVEVVAGWLSGRDLLFESPLSMSAGETGLASLALALPPDVSGVGPKDRSPLRVFYTSGTTGTPKGVVHTDASLLAGLALTVSVQAELLSLSLEDLQAIRSGQYDSRTWDRLRIGIRLLSGMSLRTISGYTILQRTLLTGETLVIVDTTDHRSINATLDRCHVTSMSIPGIVAQRMLIDRGTGNTVTSLMAAGFGGGPVDPRLAERFEDVFGCEVAVGYGMTELGGPVAMSMPGAPSDLRWTTVGKPLPGVRLRLEEPASISDEGPRALSVSSPAMAIGVVERGAFRRLDAEWFSTGDSGLIDENGALRLHGRTSRVVIRGGRCIDPERLEAYLRTDPAVVSVRVDGVPSRLQGEEDLVAMVVPQNPGAPPTLRDFRASLRNAGLEQIHRLQLVASLPSTADGASSMAPGLHAAQSSVSRPIEKDLGDQDA
jgi:acyl-CoA synthetase (AMP-forming)/AMP-acid ligase II